MCIDCFPFHYFVLKLDILTSKICLRFEKNMIFSLLDFLICNACGLLMLGYMCTFSPIGIRGCLVESDYDAFFFF